MTWVMKQGTLAIGKKVNVLAPQPGTVQRRCLKPPCSDVSSVCGFKETFVRSLTDNCAEVNGGT